jgi:hypothetical protein
MRYGKPVYMEMIRFNSATAAGDFVGVKAADIRTAIAMREPMRGYRVSYEPIQPKTTERCMALMPTLCTHRLGAYNGGRW